MERTATSQGILSHAKGIDVWHQCYILLLAAQLSTVDIADNTVNK